MYPVEEALTRFFRVAPPGEAKERTRDRLLLAAQHRPPPSRRRAKRLVLALAATLVLSAGSLAAALPVSAGSLPGDALYRVKLAGEGLRLTFARGPAADLRLHLEFAQTRIDEMGRALEAGRAVSLAELDRRYSAHIGNALDLAQGDNGSLTLVLGAMERHRSTLAGLLEDAPSEAAEALRHSIAVASDAEESVIDALARAEANRTGAAADGSGSAPVGEQGSGGTGAPPPAGVEPGPKTSGSTGAGQPVSDGSPPPSPGSTPTPTSVPSSPPSTPPSPPPSPAPSGQPTSTPPARP